MNLRKLIYEKYGDKFKVYVQNAGNIIGISGQKIELEAETEAINELFLKLGYRRSGDVSINSGITTFDSDDIIYVFIRQ